MKKEALLYMFVLILLGHTSTAFAISISNVKSLNTTTTSTQISWTADILSSYSYVMFGTTLGTYNKSSSSHCNTTDDLINFSSTATNNCIKLQNLTPNTKYYYKIISSGATSGTVANNSATSFSEGSFYTLPLTISAPMVTCREGTLNVNGTCQTITPSTPSSFMAHIITNSNSPSINLSWLDVSNETNYKITRTNLGGISFTLPLVNANTTTFTDVGLSPDSYTYKIQACNADVCSSSVSAATVTIPTPITTCPNGTTLVNNTCQTISIYTNSWCKSIGWDYITDTQNGYCACDSGKTYSGDLITGRGGVCQLNTAGTTINTATTTSAPIIKLSFSNDVTLDAISSTLATVTTSTLIATTTVATFDTNWCKSIGWDYITDTQNGYCACNSGRIYSADLVIGRGGVCQYVTATTTINTTTTTNIATTTSAPIIKLTFSDDIVDQTPISPTNATALRTYTGNSLSNNIRISWSDNSNNETNFKINRSSINSNTELPVIPANSKYFDDINVPAGTYTYYIASCLDKTCSSSALSPSVSIPEPLVISEVTINSQGKVESPDDDKVNDHDEDDEISNAVGGAIPGSFINLIPLQENSNNLKFTTTALQSGSFVITVPDGKYMVEGITPTKQITIVNRKVISVIEQIEVKAKKISGTVLYTDGKPVNDAEIHAYKNETGQWLTSRTDVNGKYNLALTGGIWEIKVKSINYEVSTWETTQLNYNIYFSNENVEELKEINFIARPVSSELTINVTDEEGYSVSDAGVTIDTISSSNTNNLYQTISRKLFTKTTPNNGKVIFRDIPGTYYVRVSVPDSTKYINPAEEKIDLGVNTKKSFSFTLKKDSTLQKIKVTGVTKFDDGTPTESSVFAWSDQGGQEQVKTSLGGKFSLELIKNQTWHLKANKDVQNKSYESTERTIVANTNNQFLDMVFIKNDSTPLSATVTQKKDVAEQVVVMADDGARFLLPPNAVTSTGKIDVEIKPTTEAPSHAASAIVSTTYDITIKNSDGDKLSKLKSEAEIMLPYDEDELKAKGVALENVIPSYYDENINTWVSVQKFTINKEKKVFILRVDHLTRFALIAAADTVAPSSPTSIVTDAITPTDVKITWQNPANDFNHSKIYRSDKFGTTGNIIATEVFSNSFIDKTFSSNEKTYYYTVRAVDAAGNESNNNNQIVFLVKGDKYATSNKKTSLLLPPGQISNGQISRTLSLGSKGDDVTSLQEALKYDGFYATGPITGYYGKLTENAVFRFQNYYKNELLIPNGYKIGTGVLGPISRKKINDIIVKSVQ